MDSSTQKLIKKIDWITVILGLGIAIFGVLCVASATSVGYEEGQPLMEYVGSLFTGNALRQLIFLGIGVAVSVALLFINYSNLKDYANVLYFIAVGLLAVVLVFGSKSRGMRGWINVFGIGLQASELCKVIAIIVFANEFSKITEGQKVGARKLSELWPVFWKCVLLIALIVVQPDFGTAMIYVGIAGGLMIMSKTSLKILLPLIGAAVGALPILWMVLSDTQKARIYVFLDPTLDPDGDGYNIIRAKNVSSAGGMHGKGLFSKDLLTQKSNYLPEKQTDFIFSSTCEAIGFVGAFIFVLLYLFFIFRLFRLSMRAKDDFGSYIIMGVAFMLLFHFIENVGMNIGLMPVTGIPLSLISYGGSNLMASIVGIGLCINVDMRRARNNRLRNDVILKDSF